MEELKSLVARARGGDLDAYTQIVCCFQDMAVGYAFSILGDFHLAEDAAQEAFLQAYLDLGKLDELAAFPGWFRRIVFKQCDRIRRQRHHFEVPLDEERFHAAGPDPGEHLEEQERSDWLKAGIRELPTPERAVFTLFHIADFSHKEIAAFLEVPETTINNRLHAAKKRLQKELETMTQGNLQEKRPSRDEAFSGRVREHLEAIRTLHEKLVPPLTALLSEPLNTEVKVEITSVNHTIAVEAIQHFTNPCCTYSFAPESGQKRIILDVGMELAGALVGRNPAAGDTLRVVDVAHLSQEEIPRLNLLAKQMLKELIGIWQEVLAMGINQAELETNPFYHIANPKGKFLEPEDPIFHVLLTVCWADHKSQLNLCYPSASLAAALARLQQR